MLKDIIHVHILQDTNTKIYSKQKNVFINIYIKPYP